MKKFKIDTNLVKSLVNSDFLLIEKRKSKNKDNLRFEGLRTSVCKRDISLLDPLEVLKTLKQMIRVFHFAKINTKYKTDLHFFLNEDNTLLSYLLKNSLDNVLVNSQISFAINEGSRVSKNFVRSKNFCLGFILDKDISRDKNFMKKQFYKGNYLFFKVNSNIESVQNSYKMYNNFDDYKKILFFISFLKQILISQYSLKSYEIQKKV